MEREPGAAEGSPEPAGTGRGRSRSAAMDVLILAAEPGADVPLKTSAYAAMTATRPPVERSPERLALYLLRLLAGVLAGGAAMLATSRWTHLAPSVVQDAFFGVLIAVMTLVAA